MIQKLKNVLIQEYKVVITAFMFFTRLPMPVIKNYDNNLLQQSSKYFSWVGVFIGLIAGLSIVLFQMIFNQHLAVALSMVTTILITGAFHEDGFADSCDAFGGGWQKDKILTIMKDSRLGTYGVVGLIGILSVKYLALLHLLQNSNWFTISVILIIAHSSSRFFAVLMMQFLPYVQDIDLSKSKPLATVKLSLINLIVAAIGGLIGFIFVSPLFIVLLFPFLLVFLYIKYYFNKWIGGYTGDCLGATQQIFEVLLYLTAILLYKFILK